MGRADKLIGSAEEAQHSNVDVSKFSCGKKPVTVKPYKPKSNKAKNRPKVK